MKPFDIFMWQAPGWSAPHPAVVVSHPQRAAAKERVEVVLCTSQRVNRQPDSHEILLDKVDGLDWETICKCDLIYAVPREDLKQRKGRVSEARQGILLRRILSAHGWNEVLIRG